MKSPNDITNSDLVAIGSIGKSHGLKGSFFLNSYCDPEDNFFTYKRLFLIKKKKVLESITHPLVRELMAEKIQAFNSLYSIIMVPLIFETKSTNAYNRILVIDCDSHLQLERATLRDDNSKEQIQKILDFQCSREQRLSIANDVISNNDSLDNLQARCLAMHKFYLGLCNT